jgi:hypothetical protein
MQAVDLPLPCLRRQHHPCASTARRPFLDRAIPVAVAEALAVPMAEAMAHDERRPRGWDVLASLAKAAAAPDTAMGATAATPPVTLTDRPEHLFQEQTEQVIHDVADDGRVILAERAPSCCAVTRPTSV